MYINDTTCCGLKEMEGLDYAPKDLIQQLADETFNDGLDYAFILFTDAVEEGNGIALAKYLRARPKLGALTTTRPRINPNSDRMIQCWIWSVNRRELKKFFIANGGEIGSDVGGDDLFGW